jgi:DNA polymerase-1
VSLIPPQSSAESPLSVLRTIMREAIALGARFRLTGGDVDVENLDRLPSTLGRRLLDYRTAGWLYPYLGGEELDKPAIELGTKLRVRVALVEDGLSARAAIRALIHDCHTFNGTIGLDVETAAKPGRGPPRQTVRLTAEGIVAEQQPAATGPGGKPDRTLLDPHLADIACLQLYAGGESCFVFRREALQMVLSSHWLRRQHLVVHNLAFETRFITSSPYRRAPGRRYRGREECSMQAAGLLFGAEHSAHGGRALDNVAKRLLDLDVPKDLATSDWGALRLSVGQLAYAASDAVLAYRLWPDLKNRLKRVEHDAVRHCDFERWGAYELQRQVIPAVADMQNRGLLLDRDEHQRQTDGWAQALAQDRREYHELTGHAPPSNANEVRDWLARTLVPERNARWPRTQTGLLSIEQNNLKRLVDVDSARPVLGMLAKEKLLSTFGRNLLHFINPVTGRIHCDYNIAATKAGRFSASSPNLQQIPSRRAPEFKQCFVAAPGRLFVGCDYDQIELRATAWITGDLELNRCYTMGLDLHVVTAAAIAGIPAEEVSAAQRQAAKPVNYGSIYGVGAATLRENAFADYGIDLTQRQAQHQLDSFFNRFRQLKPWFRRHAEVCQRRGYVVIGSGRVVEAAWEKGGQLYYSQYCNLPIQGIAADCFMRALILVHARLRQAHVRGGLVACVHDEILLEVDADDAEAARAILEQSMIDAFAEIFPDAPVNGVAAAKIGKTWVEVK